MKSHTQLQGKCGGQEWCIVPASTIRSRVLEGKEALSIYGGNEK